MKPIFEARYISIKWKNENSILKITESISSIPIEIDNNIYSIELQVYKRLKGNISGQIAFHILDENSNIKPYFLDVQNNKIALLKIKDPHNNKIWWIENGKLQGQFRASSLWNHVGDAKIVFGNIYCNIDIRANSFTKEQLDSYLEEFKNDFWYLIFKPDSLTKGKAKSKDIKLLNEESITTINKFIENSQKILKNPKRELREIQNRKDIKEVKPVARTFMEIATKGLQRKMTSRDTIESYNVPENRYIYYMANKVHFILLNIEKASKHMEHFYEKGHNYHQERLKKFTNKLNINKKLFENEIKSLEQRVYRDREELESAILKQNDSIRINYEQQIKLESLINQSIKSQSHQNIPNEPPRKHIIKLENRQNDYGNKIQFWGKIKNIDSKNWDFFAKNNWFSLEFYKIFDFFKDNQEFKITGYNNYIQQKTQKGIIHKIFFNYIMKLEFINKIVYKTITIKITKTSFFKNLIQCHGEIKLENGQWDKLKNNDFYSFEFDKNIFNSLINDSSVYKISAYISYSKQLWNRGNIHKVSFKYITDIELLDSISKDELKKLKEQKPILEGINWQRELKRKEKGEQEKEKQALIKSIQQLKEYQQKNHKLLKELSPLINKVSRVLNQFKNLKIEQSSYFPNSMTFIQNPNYQGTHKFYKKIKNIVGIDESLFIQMQIIEDIGLVNIPIIYERWSLLQIIKVLIDKYHFIPEKNWKLKLSNQMIEDINNIRDIKIKFINDEMEKEIILWYEHELSNRKRPDFIVDIKSTKNNKKHRLIMDAKFHEKVDIEKQIELLYFKKNYSENFKNTVFILHPDLNPIKNPRTPTAWGNNSFYGETDLFYYKWDTNRYPNHKYGAILLSPFNSNGRYLDNLQRVIGMVMQYNMEENNQITTKSKNKIIKIDSKPIENIFCLPCGSSNCSISKPIPASKFPNRWQYQIICQEKYCGRGYSYNYCWNCKHRLIKNDRYWSYHSLQIFNEYDVRCPNCNKLLIERSQE